jgi:hypothetical protein
MASEIAHTNRAKCFAIDIHQNYSHIEINLLFAFYHHRPCPRRVVATFSFIVVVCSCKPFAFLPLSPTLIAVSALTTFYAHTNSNLPFGALFTSATILLAHKSCKDHPPFVSTGANCPLLLDSFCPQSAWISGRMPSIPKVSYLKRKSISFLSRAGAPLYFVWHTRLFLAAYYGNRLFQYLFRFKVLINPNFTSLFLSSSHKAPSSSLQTIKFSHCKLARFFRRIKLATRQHLSPQTIDARGPKVPNECRVCFRIALYRSPTVCPIA